MYGMNVAILLQLEVIAVFSAADNPPLLIQPAKLHISPDIVFGGPFTGSMFENYGPEDAVQRLQLGRTRFARPSESRYGPPSHRRFAHLRLGSTSFPTTPSALRASESALSSRRNFGAITRVVRY